MLSLGATIIHFLVTELMKLSKRYLIVLPLLVTFAYLFYSAYKDVRDKTLNDFNSEQFTLAKQASRGIESFFIYYQRELTFLSKLRYVIDPDDQGKHLLADFYNSHSDQIEAISVIDSKGIIKFTYPLNPSSIGKDISSQHHVKTVIETHKPTVSDVFTSVQGFRAIAYHVPVFVANDYKGSLGILIPIDKLGKRFVENIRTGDTGYGWMISEDGIDLYDPSDDRTGNSAMKIFSNSPDVLKMIGRTSNETSGISTCIVPVDKNGENEFTRILSAFYRIPLGNTFWTIIISTPEHEVFSRLTAFRNRMFILIALIIIVITAYFYLSFKASNILKEEKKRKAVEKTLTESERRFRVMFELSPAGMILIDEKGTVKEVNSSFCEMLGYARNEILGNNIRLFAAPYNNGDIEKNISVILSGKTMVHEVTNIKKDGTSIIIILYETLIILPDGSAGILSVANDITDRMKVQRELIQAKDKAEESDRLKSVFLTNMSHELRTPLNAIIGFSGLIAEAGPDENTIFYSKTILKSGQHLLSLVEDIFNATMIETGQIKINYEKVNVDSLLKEVGDIIHGERLSENKTDVELMLNSDGMDNDKFLLTDSRKLKQVLLNILRNALKFTDAGSIEFGSDKITDNGKKCFLFYIRDTGMGIDKKYHEEIFSNFRQIDDTHTRKFGGMGIGLSLAKKTVEILGGRIWVESELSKGSVFYFTIPGVISKDQLAEHISTKMTKNYEGKTILIAEDEQSNFDFLKILLNRMNIRVLWARDGREAVRITETEQSINLILMDIKMPLLNGYEATRLIKKAHPELPVVAQTAYATISDKMEADKAGCDNYLSKPIRINQLIEMLELYLER